MQYNTIARWVAPSVLAMAGSFTVALLLTAALAKPASAPPAQRPAQKTPQASLYRRASAPPYSPTSSAIRGIWSWHRRRCLRQHLERPLLSERHAARRRLPGRAEGYEGHGSADSIQRFGETMAQGGHGGTGIAIYKNGLYAESTTASSVTI